jgi:hypothetical protein
MIRTVRLTLAHMSEPYALMAIDDERRRTRDIEGGQPEAMIHTVALDHRAIRVDEDRQVEPVGVVVIGHFRRTLTDDHQHPSSEGLIGREMGLQLLQLPAAVRSPGAADEHDHRGFGGQHVDESNFLSFASPQGERRGDVSHP